MRVAMPIACLAVLALAGCKQQPSVKMTNASVDQVMKTQASAVKMKPGQWEVAAEMLDMKMTGAPAGAPPLPQQAKVTSKVCLTAAQVEKPTAMLGQGMEQLKNSCTYDTFEMKGGRIDAAMHCNMPQGQTVSATTHGTFSETAMSTESESKVGGLPNGMGVTTRMKMEAHRLGDCPAGAAGTTAG